MTVAMFFVIVLFAAALWYLGSPFFSAASSAPAPGEAEGLRKQDLTLKKEEILESLKDLELDHRMKKLSDEDFKELYDENFREGTEILRRLDQEARPAAPAPAGQLPKFCTQCGHALAPQTRFCAQCGHRIHHAS